MNRALFLILIGFGGAAILMSLGVWQVQRLAWKEGVLADIEARIDASPVSLPEDLDPVADRYLPVQVEGTWVGDTLRVLVSQKDIGAGYRLITALEIDNRRIMIDRGFLPADADAPNLADGPVRISGNLHWPQETDSFTPAPDVSKNIWFARDVGPMAKALATQPILLIAREILPTEYGMSPLPVDTSRIPNNHLQYAITWFSLAVLWLAMSLLFSRRQTGVRTSESGL